METAIGIFDAQVCVSNVGVALDAFGHYFQDALFNDLQDFGRCLALKKVDS